MAHASYKKILGSVISLVMAAIIFSAVNLGFDTAARDIPLGGKSGFDLPSTFTLSVTGTPAPAISCSITNNVHLIGTDNSDYSVSDSGKMFSPLLNLVVPSTGKILDHVNVKIFIYCNTPPSPYSQYGYAPYLTGGSLSLQVQVHDVNGLLRNVGTYQTSVSAISSAISGSSIQIASFSIPASSIYAVTGASSGFLTDVNAITGGTLTFIESKSTSQLVATAQLNPVASYFGLQVNPSTTSSTTSMNTQQSIAITSPTASSNYQLDWSSSHTVSYQVTVDDWTTSQPYPVIVVYGYNSNQPYSSGLQINSSPSVSSSNGHSIYTWNGKIDLTNIDGFHSITSNGCYSLQLQPVSLAGGLKRYASTISFCVKNYNGDSSSSSSFAAKTYFLYTANYAGRQDSVIAGQAPVASQVNLNLGDFIKAGFPYNGLGSIDIQPIIDFTGLPQVQVSNAKINQYIWLDVGGTLIQNLNVQYASVNSNTGNNQVVISKIQVLPSDITNAISEYDRSHFPIALTNNENVVINVALNGTFDATAGGKFYHGVLSTMTFTYGIVYVPSAQNPSDKQPTTINNQSSGGNCMGLTPQQCAANSGSQPNGGMLNDQNNGGCNSSDPNAPCFVNIGTQNSTTTFTSNTNTTPTNNGYCTNVFGGQSPCSVSNSNSNSTFSTNTGGPPSSTSSGAGMCPTGYTIIQCAQALNQLFNGSNSGQPNLSQYSQYLPMIVVAMIVVIILFVILKVAKSKK